MGETVIVNATKLRKQLGRKPGECTWCGKAVPKGRRTWCCQKCVDAYRGEHDWSWIREQVLQRDKGICAICGVDTLEICNFVLKTRRREGFETGRHLTSFYATLGWHDLTVISPWQADHIKPRVLGGTNEQDNLRTLCVPCHKRETAKLAASLAAVRRDADRPLLGVTPDGYKP